MAKILFLVDFEEGHVLSTMSLSKTLAARGHEILYAGLADAAGLVTAQGFAFHAIMQDLFPEGIGGPGIRSLRAGRTLHSAFAAAKGACFARCVSGELFADIREFQPDAAVALSYYYLEALAIHLRFELPVIFFTPDLRTVSRAEAASSIIDGLMNSTFGVAEFLELLRRTNTPVRSLADIVRLLVEMPELIALPRSFEEPGIRQDPLVYYVGGGVDMKRRESGRQWQNPAGGKPLIYCSLGSQCALELEASLRFFNTVIRAMAGRPEWHMLLSTGNAAGADSLIAPPPNVTVSSWAPQMEVLADASLMINHGGIGTVKECILSRVPMVVFPLMRDQFDCAKRVVRLGLGISQPLDEATPEAVAGMIAAVLADSGIRQRIDAMSESFRNEDCIQMGAEVVEQAAGRGFPSRRSAAQETAWR